MLNFLTLNCCEGDDSDDHSCLYFQSTPLIRLQTDIDIDTGQRMLTCYLLPQQHSDDRDGETLIHKQVM